MDAGLVCDDGLSAGNIHAVKGHFPRLIDHNFVLCRVKKIVISALCFLKRICAAFQSLKGKRSVGSCYSRLVGDSAIIRGPRDSECNTANWLSCIRRFL